MALGLLTQPVATLAIPALWAIVKGVGVSSRVEAQIASTQDIPALVEETSRAILDAIDALNAQDALDPAEDIEKLTEIKVRLRNAQKGLANSHTFLAELNHSLVSSNHTYKKRRLAACRHNAEETQADAIELFQKQLSPPIADVNGTRDHLRCLAAMDLTCADMERITEVLAQENFNDADEEERAMRKSMLGAMIMAFGCAERLISHCGEEPSPTDDL